MICQSVMVDHGYEWLILLISSILFAPEKLRPPWLVNYNRIARHNLWVGQRWKSQRVLKLTFTVEEHCLPLHILYITFVFFCWVSSDTVDNSDCFIPKKPLIPSKKSDEAILRRDQPIQSVGITLWLNSCLNAITYLYSLYTSILYVYTHITSYVYLYVIHRYIHIIYIHMYICNVM